MDGKDKGKVGEVMRVLRKDNRVLVTGLNLVIFSEKLFSLTFNLMRFLLISFFE